MSEPEGRAFTSEKIRWHILLGAVLDPLLRPVDIDVFTELSVMKMPPTADILLLRRHNPSWSQEQMERLPDGIRDTRAGRILIEFKYSESVNEDALCQSVGYDYFYRTTQELKEEDVQTVLLSSRTPQKATLNALGYRTTEHSGVFRSEMWVIRKILLLSLNDLDDSPHNAAFKCFASRRQERLAAFGRLYDDLRNSLSDRFWWVLNGLWNVWFFQGGDIMSEALNPLTVAEVGRKLEKRLLESLSVEQRLAGLKPEDILRNVKPEDILRNVKPEDILRNVKPEDILRNFKPEDILKDARPEEVLRHFKPEEIEQYLQKVKQNASGV